MKTFEQDVLKKLDKIIKWIDKQEKPQTVYLKYTRGKNPQIKSITKK